MRFSGWEAATAAGLDLERWENHGYPIAFMESTIAWKTLHDLVEQHKEEAGVTAAKKKSQV